MLTKVRIEVEEQTVAETVDALARYEAALTVAEAQRYDTQWPHEYVVDPLQSGEHRRRDPEPSYHWDLAELPDYGFQLGRELVEEVIEYDQSIPAWKGRMVVAYRRLDGREGGVVFIDPDSYLPGSFPRGSGTSGSGGVSVRIMPRDTTGDDPNAPQNT